MRNNVLILALVMTGAVGVMAVGAFAVLTHPRPAATPHVPDEDIDLVKVGMTRGDVVRILGGPPGEYAPGGMSLETEGYRGKGYEVWVCSERTLFVKFGEHGTATDVARASTFFRTRSAWEW